MGYMFCADILLLFLSTIVKHIFFVRYISFFVFFVQKNSRYRGNSKGHRTRSRSRSTNTTNIAHNIHNMVKNSKNSRKSSMNSSIFAPPQSHKTDRKSNSSQNFKVDRKSNSPQNHKNDRRST